MRYKNSNEFNSDSQVKLYTKNYLSEGKKVQRENIITGIMGELVPLGIIGIIGLEVMSSL